jgi:hypothetical protein
MLGKHFLPENWSSPVRSIRFLFVGEEFDFYKKHGVSADQELHNLQAKLFCLAPISLY